jgi:aminopeptidase N
MSRAARLWLAVVGMVAFALGAWYFLVWRAPRMMGDSGGPLRPRQAAYDVRRYELDLRVDPERRSLAGRGTAIVAAVASLDAFEIHLDSRLAASAATVDGAAAAFTHADGLVTVALAAPWRAGERHRVAIDYAGKPKIARRPPWSDGLVWRKTPGGAHWIGVTAQGDGGDLWWPAKDHPSDEPDEGRGFALTLPSTLVGLSNGRKAGERVNDDGTTTTRWEVSYPINNYAFTFNAAPYVPIEATYRGVDGARAVPIVFWAIPEHAEPARRLWREQGARILEVLGRRFGEYPFLDDKYHVAESPYLGMEHQSLVAYGSTFENNEYGFDWLLLHETAHEWWGNQVTARDWADFWLHEGFGSYSEAVYVNDTLGVDRYLAFMKRVRAGVRNERPIVAGRDLTSGEAYVGDIYSKGAAVLHTLRWLLGDEKFFEVLRRWAGGGHRLVETADFERLVAEIAERETPWFWQRYLRRAEPPRWSLVRTSGREGRETILLGWDDPAFELPLPVAIGGEERRIEMTGGRARLEVAAGTEVVVDPRGWVLAEPATPADAARAGRAGT